MSLNAWQKFDTSGTFLNALTKTVTPFRGPTKQINVHLQPWGETQSHQPLLLWAIYRYEGTTTDNMVRNIVPPVVRKIPTTNTHNNVKQRIKELNVGPV